MKFETRGRVLRIPSWPWPTCSAEIYDAGAGARRLCGHAAAVVVASSGGERVPFCSAHGKIQRRALGMAGELCELEPFETFTR